MKRFALFSSLLLSSLFLHSQMTQELEIVEITSPFDLALGVPAMSDSGMVMVSSFGQEFLLFGWIDDSGRIGNVAYPNPSMQMAVRALATKDGQSYFLASTVQIDSLRRGLGIAKMNNHGVIQAEGTALPTGVSDNVADMILLSTGGGMVCGSSRKSYSNGLMDMYFAGFNDQAQIEWTKTYSMSYFSQVNDIIEISGGYIFATGSAPQNGQPNGGVLIQLNTVGDTILTRRFGHQEAKGYDIFEAINSDILVLGQDDTSNTGSQIKATIMCRFDPLNGNLIYENEHFPSSQYLNHLISNKYVDACQTLDGGILVLTSCYFDLQSSFPEGAVPLLTKYNQNGQTEWETLITQDGLSSDPYEVIALPNGDFMLYGLHSSTSTNGFSYLLSDKGSTSTIDPHHKLEWRILQESDFVTIEWEQVIPSETVITVTDLQGRMIEVLKQDYRSGFNSQRIPTNHLSSSIYVINIQIGEVSEAKRFLKR